MIVRAIHCGDDPGQHQFWALDSLSALLSADPLHQNDATDLLASFVDGLSGTERFVVPLLFCVGFALYVLGGLQLATKCA